MSPACRPGTAVAATLVIAATVWLSLRGLARVVVPGVTRDASAPLVGPRVRAWYRGVLEPLEDALVGARVHPDALTWAQLAVSVLAGAVFWAGWLFVGGWLTIVAGTLDVLDGGVARRAGVESRRGALVDSLVDRWAEFATFLGLGAFYRDSWVLVPLIVACFGSFMVSYTRARAEGLGVEAQLGRVQRPERYVILGCGAWASDLVAHLTCTLTGRPTQVVLAAAIVVLAALSAWTALERARHAAAALRQSAP
ncbi:MAG: CDP-alcohol phosphatidyltransferase family protein [Deltaproteobacteria bacterium]|nr:MAG: CDP-alcohol phosphatidyltransferase family protein [Deltaproteobacteria bacterium]